MSLKELESKAMKFVEFRWRNAPQKPTEQEAFVHLSEEVGEVARQLFNKKLGSDKYDEENLKEEIVDVFLDVLILANMSGVDLEVEAKKKLDSLFERTEMRK